MHVVTVATGDYFLGAAALINSLASFGFDGTVTVAHDSPLAWDLHASSRVKLHAFDVDSGKAPTNRKGQLMRIAGSGDVLYIDADCIVTSPTFIDIVGKLLEEGPVFTAEAILPRSDVRHWAWAHAYGTNNPTGNAADCIAYLNAGFMALRLPRDLEFLDQYQKLIDHSLIGRGEFFSTPYFPLADQDCLNAVAANINRRFFTLGPPDIWYRTLRINPFFLVGASTFPLFLHCTGAHKPWRLTTPPSLPPDIYDDAYYRYSYRETKWVAVRHRLAPDVDRWFRKTLTSRVSLKLRSRLGRSSQYLARLRGK